jgi:cytoskeletal protein CcmA (bactofilin family)
MLGRKKDEPIAGSPPPLPIDAVAAADLPVSVVAADLAVTGNLTSKGEIRVHGRVEGNIRCDTLLISKGAEVTGDVIATSARLCGGTTGKITADTVFITKTARIQGDIHHNSVSIEHGAQVEGRLVRIAREDAKAGRETAEVVPLSDKRPAESASAPA